MGLFIEHVFALLTTWLGNLVYILVLALSVAGALWAAVRLLRSSAFPQARRIVFGLAVILFLQLVQFAAGGLALLGVFNSQSILPPLDRVVTLISLILIGWLWAFPEPMRLADGGALLLSLLAFALLGLTLLLWAPRSTQANFNGSIFDRVWQITSLLIALLGVGMLLVRRPNGWVNGMTMLILASVGHIVSVLWPMTGYFPGGVRLTQIVMYPILLTLSRRFQTTTIRPSEAGPEQPIVERRRYSTDPKTFHALMSLAAETDPDKLGHAITRGIAQAMLADLCFLITLTEDKNLIITCGYDLIREENLDGIAVDKDHVPLLANAIQRGRPLRLPASSTSSDLKGLGEMLGLTNSGHLLSVPIVSPGHGPLGGILILSPYSNRLWNAEDQNYLSNVSTLFVTILERGQRLAAIDVEREQAQQEVQSAQEQAAEAQRKVEEITLQIENLRAQASQAQLQADNLATLIGAQEESQKAIDQLKSENEQLRKSGSPGMTGNTEQLERELRRTLEEMARMQNSLAQANIKILELEKRPTSPITSEQVEVIASISQELRQPMSSIVGYTDLLLGESVGILGALQHKFVERIKASTERIGGLIDDLIQITTLETGQREFNPELIDLNLIIDNAMAYTGTQIREKNITLRLDIPEEPPKVQTDRDALQQVLIHLLQNASAATPTEGTITLRVQIRSDDDNHFLLFQVADSGGGIAADDIQRVFARRYRADNSLIQGLGDTGVGLSIAKTLVEAQNGRIWVETEMGTGSTFSILLPVSLDGQEEKQP